MFRPIALYMANYHMEESTNLHSEELKSKDQTEKHSQWGHDVEAT